MTFISAFQKKTIGFVSLSFFLLTQCLNAQSEKIFTKTDLINDTRQLVEIIESSHPDPYINGGGKINFHRRFQHVLRNIPEKGLTKSNYYKILLPFVSSIGDSHTAVINRDPDQLKGPGIPFSFKIVDGKFILTEVNDENYKYLLGYNLINIEGIPVKDLLIRQANLRGIENESGRMAFLSLSIKSLQGLSLLLPEWKNMNKIKIAFQSSKDEKVEIDNDLTKENQKSFSIESSINIPSVEKSDIVYRFYEDKKLAYLRIEGMERYREASESWYTSGLSEAESYSKIAYEHFNEGPAPGSKEQILKGIPSATEIFMDLISDMEKYKTDNLIVDLRNNTGGNSIMKEILIYFLFGKEAITSVNEGYSIMKYSDLYFKNYENDSIEKINLNQAISLKRSDYDFGDEKLYSSIDTDKRKNDIEESLKKTPTFWKEYINEEYHKPKINMKNIIVLCSPFTYSSGFNMMTALKDHGAQIVGTTSAQPPTNYGDMLLFHLNNTQLLGAVSYKYIITYPNNNQNNNSLIPDHQLTMSKFNDYKNDPNAELLWAIDLLKN